MPSSTDGNSAANRIAERLAEARRRQFVGRAAELELFRSALESAVPPFSVLHIYGPGGIGKTTLLGAYARLAEGAGRPVIRLDAREIQPSAHGFIDTLTQGLGLDQGQDPFVALSGLERVILLIDTFENIESLDAWVRTRLLPILPASSLTVIAGRNPPASAWRTEPGWSELVRIVSLRNLRPEESRTFLAARGITDDQCDKILSYTYGHPLALSLAAEVAQQGRRVGDLTSLAADLVQPLLERFVAVVPSRHHREALEAAAIARRTTQSILKAALALDDDSVAYDIFQWLRRLPVMEQGPHGLFPHDVVREVIYEDLRWRDPDHLRELERRIVRVETDRLFRSRGIEQQRAFWDLLFLSRYLPFTRPFYDWTALGGSYVEPARPEDSEAILAMVERHEGAASAQIAGHWFRRQPAGFYAFRSAEGELTGFAANLAFDQADEHDEAIDPAVGAIRRYVAGHGPVRTNEKISVFRYWMDRDDYQNPAVNNVAATLATTSWISEPGLAWAFVTIRDRTFWQPMFAALNFHSAAGADFVVGDHQYSFVGHDWRTEPPLAWWQALGRRPDLGTPPNPTPRAMAPLVVLSQPEFRDAVRRAYRDFRRPDALVANPLLRSRLVLIGQSKNRPVEALQALLRAAVDALNTYPREQKLYRALWRTYIEPAASQEAAAEALDLPFSTYRRHLNAGLERVTEWLWQRELYGSEAGSSPHGPVSRAPVS